MAVASAFSFAMGGTARMQNSGEINTKYIYIRTITHQKVSNGK
jgi:hypothetical protein